MRKQKDSIDGTDYGKRKQFSLISSQQMPDADRHLTYVVCLRSYRELPAHPSPYPPCPLSNGKGIRYEKTDFLTWLSFHDLRASPISFAAKPPPSFLIPNSSFMNHPICGRLAALHPDIGEDGISENACEGPLLHDDLPPADAESFS